MLDSVEEAWAAVPENTVARSFRSCDISNALDGLEENDLHDGLADAREMAPEDWGGLQVEYCEFFFF